MNYLDSIDIDNLEDFKNAEIILKLKKKKWKNNFSKKLILCAKNK